MFNPFKRNKNHKKEAEKAPVQMVDIDGMPLKAGDMVMSLRYELGMCRIIEAEGGLAYESLETGKVVHYARMIDAATSYQKVRKVAD